MKPILQENDAILGKPGLKGGAWRVEVALFNDHIEAHNKKGISLLDAPLSSITDAQYKGGVFIKFTVNGQVYTLNLQSRWQRYFGALFVVFGALGAIIGALLGRKIGSSSKKAENWALSMEQNGVKF